MKGKSERKLLRVVEIYSLIIFFREGYDYMKRFVLLSEQEYGR